MIDAVNGLFLAVPDFVWALALVLAFGVVLPLLPLTGRVDPSVSSGMTTPFYLAESLLSLRFDVFADLLTISPCRRWRSACPSPR